MFTYKVEKSVLYMSFGTKFDRSYMDSLSEWLMGVSYRSVGGGVFDK